MADESRPLDKRQPLELVPDFPYESRHEFVEKLAYSCGSRGDALSVHRTSTGSQQNKLCMRR
jgi:hypothetical protein